MLRCKLPADILTLLEEYIGPCPLQKARKEKVIELFRTGRLGISHWIVTYLPASDSGSDQGAFHYCLVYPNHEHVESAVRGRLPKRPWEFNERRATLYPDDRGVIYYKYRIFVKEEDRRALLRRQIFVRAGTMYSSGSEGERTTPFDLSYEDARNEDLLYILKYTYGEGASEVLRNLERRFMYFLEIEGTPPYQARIFSLVRSILERPPF
jgi:hypothetical protein